MIAGKERTTQQLVGSGQPAAAATTSNLWVSREGVFSQPTFGNTVNALTTGADYFADLIATLDAAEAGAEVLIAGWQVNWDALLAPGVRLYDVVYRNAKRGLRFFIMPWDDTNPVQTYETQTKVVLESINIRLKQEGVTSAGAISVMPAKSQSDRNSKYFSHHQKQVIVGRKTAYVGGIDLAYGRFDDEVYDLSPNAKGRRFLNSYNPGIPPMKGTKPEDGTTDPDLMSGAADRFSVPLIAPVSTAEAERKRIESGGWQVRYQNNSPVLNFNKPTLEGNDPDPRTLREDQPRMPWQDVHCRIEGPTVVDLTRNFVRRWNSLADSKDRLPEPPAPQAVGPDETSACIQLLRSAPATLNAAENKVSSIKSKSDGFEDDIHTAWKQLIDKADHFIYIENQFFVSAFGSLDRSTRQLSPAAQFIKKSSGGITNISLKAMRMADSDSAADLDQLPQNGVCAALIERITRAVLDAQRPNFHVYITLPVHPEGSLLDGTIAVQVYYTMQSLVFGSNSLLNGIRRALKARELLDAKDDGWRQALDPSSTDYQSIDIEACFKYVTLLNLRNWASRSDGSAVTEQIYVHSKLIIVDDLYVLMGSANINDRSLLGMRDSELAVLIQDGQISRADINGTGKLRPVRLFAHELRKKIWAKLFGISGGVRPATELKQAIEQPGRPDSWKAIQQRARSNAQLYEAAFPFVPGVPGGLDNEGKDVPGSILPTWRNDPKKKGGGGLTSDLPDQEDFWTRPQELDAAALAGLKNVKGYITALPIEWTRNENLRIPYPTSVIVHNEKFGPNDQTLSQLAHSSEPRLNSGVRG